MIKKASFLLKSGQDIDPRGCPGVPIPVNHRDKGQGHPYITYNIPMSLTYVTQGKNTSGAWLVCPSPT